MRRPLTVAAFALALAGGIAACGGDGEEPSASPPAKADADVDEATPPEGDPNRGSADDPREGEGGEGPKEHERGPDASRAIGQAIDGFLASGEGELVCRRTVTDRFLREAYGDRRGCLDAQTAGSAARSVEVKRLDVKTAGAFAVAVPNGGPSDGDRLEIELVPEDGKWLIDRITSNVPVGP